MNKKKATQILTDCLMSAQQSKGSKYEYAHTSKPGVLVYSLPNKEKTHFKAGVAMSTLSVSEQLVSSSAKALRRWYSRLF